MEAWLWILLITIAVIGVIANAARQKSDAKTINQLKQNQQYRNEGTLYDSDGRRIK